MSDPTATGAAGTLRPGAEVAVFVTRSAGAEVLIAHRSPALGSYWHVIAGAVEPGEQPQAAAERELNEETGLAADVRPTGVAYAYSLTEEPPERRSLYDPSVDDVTVTCFRADAPDGWEPRLDHEHDDYRWCEPERAVKMLRWADTAAALATVLGLERR